MKPTPGTKWRLKKDHSETMIVELADDWTVVWTALTGRIATCSPEWFLVQWEPVPVVLHGTVEHLAATTPETYDLRIRIPRLPSPPIIYGNPVTITFEDPS